MSSLDDLQETIRKRIDKNEFRDGWDIELSKWLALIEYYRLHGIQPQTSDLDSANRFLSDTNKKPDLGIIQDIRQRMMLFFWSNRRNFTSVIVWLTGGGQAIPCVILGLLVAVLLT